VLLIEAGDRVLAAFPPTLSKRASRSLESLGVTPLVNHLVTDLDTEGVVVQSGEHEERIPAKTIIWAAGVLAASIAGRLAQAAGGKTDAVGRIIVEPDLTVEGHPEVIAIGDMVKVRSEPPFPGVAPVAMQMGRYAAKLVRARLRGETIGDFAYHDKGKPGDDRSRAGGRRPAGADTAERLRRVGHVAADPPLVPDRVPEPPARVPALGDQLPHARPRRALDHGRRALAVKPDRKLVQKRLRASRTPL